MVSAGVSEDGILSQSFMLVKGLDHGKGKGHAGLLTASAAVLPRELLIQFYSVHGLAE